jgi:hypothetical protein
MSISLCHEDLDCDNRHWREIPHFTSFTGRVGLPSGFDQSPDWYLALTDLARLGVPLAACQ